MLNILTLSNRDNNVNNKTLPTLYIVVHLEIEIQVRSITSSEKYWPRAFLITSALSEEKQQDREHSYIQIKLHSSKCAGNNAIDST
jgi:hypothetical protein